MRAYSNAFNALYKNVHCTGSFARRSGWCAKILTITPFLEEVLYSLDVHYCTCLSSYWTVPWYCLFRKCITLTSHSLPCKAHNQKVTKLFSTWYRHSWPERRHGSPRVEYHAFLAWRSSWMTDGCVHLLCNSIWQFPQLAPIRATGTVYGTTRPSRTKSHLPGHSPPVSQTGRRFWPAL